MQQKLFLLILTGLIFSSGVINTSYADEQGDRERDEALELIEQEEAAEPDPFNADPEYDQNAYNEDLNAIDDAEKEREEK